MRSIGRLVLGLLAGGLLAGPAAGVEDLSGRILLSWQSYTADELATDGLHQIYDLTWDRDLSEGFNLRLTLRAEDDASGSAILGEARSNDFRQLRPGLRLLYTLPTLRLRLDADENRSKSRSDGDDLASDRRLQRLLGQLTWRPVDLPSLTVEGWRRSAEDPATRLDQTETRGSVRLDYATNGFRVGAWNQVRDLEDSGRGFARASRDLQAFAGYSGSFWRERLAVQLDGSALRSRLEERALAGAGARVPDPVPMLGVAQAFDATPEDSRDVVLESNPLLSDGNLERPAGAPLGPAAPPNLNLAVDFGRNAEVDELRVIARDATGAPLLSGGPVMWELWTSDDRQLWSRLTSGVLSRFEAREGYWEVTFPRRTTRHLKLVTFFVNNVPTELTEVQAFLSTDLAPGEEVRSDAETMAGNATVSLRPYDDLSLSWNASLIDSVRTPDRRPETSSRDLNQTLSAVWQPRPWAAVELRGQTRTTEAETTQGRFDQSYDSLAGILRWTPVRDLTSSLELLQSDETTEGRRIRSERISWSTFARLWQTLDLSLDLSRIELDYVSEGWSSSSPAASGSVRAQLTRSLQLTATASVRQTDLSGDVPGEFEASQRDSRWSSELFWRASSQLGLGARIGRAVAGDRSGILRGYRLEWQPFPRGTVSLGALYDQELDPAADRSLQRFILTPSWRVNPSLTVSVNYTWLATAQSGIEQQTESFLASLATRF